MRSASVLVLAATALGLVDATNNFLTPYGALGKRQAFDPDESTGSGADCVEAFGKGYIECRAPSGTQRRLCINPDLGETCCEASWGCPAKSFCLVEDLCCPDGLDPKTCAAQNDVSLPPGFGVPTATLPGATGPSVRPSVTTGSSIQPIGTGAYYNATRTGRLPLVTAGAHHEKAHIAAAAVIGLAAALVF
ncbi:hypothetical protein OQA88_9931 [Cercophora sp. LCS_1]